MPPASEGQGHAHASHTEEGCLADERRQHQHPSSHKLWQPCPPLPPERHLPGELASLLLRSVGVQGEDQLADVQYPLLAPALHAIDHVCDPQ